jgi:predicted RNA-binding Zn-ribbon protein involved in translation (DUF1610 family)
VPRRDDDPPKKEPAPPRSSAPDAELHTPRRFADESRCDLCGFLLAVEHHCKIVCPNCGYTRDCSDP